MQLHLQPGCKVSGKAHATVYNKVRNYSAIALHLNPRLKYTAKRPIKRQNKVSIFLAYVSYFLYLYTYERASYGYIKSAASHDGRDAVDA